MVHVIADPQLADAVVTPAVHLAVLGERHARRLAAGDVDDPLPDQAGVHLSRRALIRADAVANLPAIVLTPGVHLKRTIRKMSVEWRKVISGCLFGITMFYLSVLGESERMMAPTRYVHDAFSVQTAHRSYGRHVY